MIFEDNIFKTAGESYKQSPFLKVLVYGDSGSGKTTWAARAPKPLILSLEDQGLASVAAANPDAIVIHCKNMDMFNAVWDAVQSGDHVDHNGQSALKVSLGKHSATIQTVVIDSLTELTQMIHDEEKGAAKHLKIDQWGAIKAAGMRIVKDARSVKANVIVTARALTESEDGKAISVPITTPKGLADDLGGHFNIVAKTGRKRGKVGIAHYLRTSGEDRVAGKSYKDLPSVMWLTTDAGRTTLGSIALHSIGDYAPHAEGDDASWVTAAPPSAEEVQKDGFGEFEDEEDSGLLV